MKKKTLKSLRNRLDAVFSVFVRTRGVDLHGYNVCVSCGRKIPWQDGDAGHYYRRQHTGTRFDPRNVHFQCKSCNGFRAGNVASYARYMYATYPQSDLDDLDFLHRQSTKLTRSDLEDLIEKYSMAV